MPWHLLAPSPSLRCTTPLSQPALRPNKVEKSQFWSGNALILSQNLMLIFSKLKLMQQLGHWPPLWSCTATYLKLFKERHLAMPSSTPWPTWKQTGLLFILLCITTCAYMAVFQVLLRASPHTPCSHHLPKIQLEEHYLWKFAWRIYISQNDLIIIMMIIIL